MIQQKIFLYSLWRPSSYRFVSGVTSQSPTFSISAVVVFMVEHRATPRTSLCRLPHCHLHFPCYLNPHFSTKCCRFLVPRTTFLFFFFLCVCVCSWFTDLLFTREHLASCDLCAICVKKTDCSCTSAAVVTWPTNLEMSAGLLLVRLHLWLLFGSDMTCVVERSQLFI